MSEDWEYVLHQAAYERLEAMSLSERRYVIAGLRELAADPMQTPDAERRSKSGRTYSIKFMRRHLVVYWLDAFVREVRILEIEPIPAR